MAHVPNIQQQRHLTPLEEALCSPPQTLVQNKSLLQILHTSAESDPNNAEQIIEACFSNLHPISEQAGFSSIIILEHCTRNSALFRKFIQSSFLQHKLYRIATTSAINTRGITSSNYQTFQRLQFDLISMLIRFHNSFKENDSFKTTIDQLTKVGKLEEYLKFVQSPNSYLTEHPFPAQSSQSPHAVQQQQQQPSQQSLHSLQSLQSPMSSNMTVNSAKSINSMNSMNSINSANSTRSINNGTGTTTTSSSIASAGLPELPVSPEMNSNQQMASMANNNDNSSSKNESKVDNNGMNVYGVDEKSIDLNNNNNNNNVDNGVSVVKYGGYTVEQLVTRDGKITVSYVLKCQKEFLALMERYIIPARIELSNESLELTEDKLQSLLQSLQLVQKRLAFVIIEVSRDPELVDLAIKANDSVVQTILWYNAMVKSNRLQGSRSDKYVNARIRDNRDIVELQQSLALYDSKLQSKIEKFNQQRAHELQKQLQNELANEPHSNVINNNNNNNIINNNNSKSVIDRESRNESKENGGVGNVSNVGNAPSLPVKNENNNNSNISNINNLSNSSGMIQVSPMPAESADMMMAADSSVVTNTNAMKFNANESESVGKNVNGTQPFDESIGNMSYSRIQNIDTPVRTPVASASASESQTRPLSKTQTESQSQSQSQSDTLLSQQMAKEMESVNLNNNDSNNNNNSSDLTSNSVIDSAMASIANVNDNNNGNNNIDSNKNDVNVVNDDNADLYEIYDLEEENNEANNEVNDENNENNENNASNVGKSPSMDGQLDNSTKPNNNDNNYNINNNNNAESTQDMLLLQQTQQQASGASLVSEMEINIPPMSKNNGKEAENAENNDDYVIENNNESIDNNNNINNNNNNNNNNDMAQEAANSLLLPDPNGNVPVLSSDNTNEQSEQNNNNNDNSNDSNDIVSNPNEAGSMFDFINSGAGASSEEVLANAENVDSASNNDVINNILNSKPKATENENSNQDSTKLSVLEPV